MFIFDWIFGSSSSRSISCEINRLLREDSEISALNKRMCVPVYVLDCGENIRALYNISNREIWIDPKCSDPYSLREALLHEMIHAYDHQVNGLKLSTLKGLATSEVHAMRQCECKNALFKKICTKEKAIQAVSLSINNEKKAQKIVDDIFEDVYYDEFYPGLFG